MLWDQCPQTTFPTSSSLNQKKGVCSYPLIAFHSIIHVKIMRSVKKPSIDVNENILHMQPMSMFLCNLGLFLGHLNGSTPTDLFLSIVFHGAENFLPCLSVFHAFFHVYTFRRKKSQFLYLLL